MRTCHRNGVVVRGDDAQDLRPLHDWKSLLFAPVQLLVTGWNSGSVNYHIRSEGNQIDVVLVVNFNAFVYQRFGKLCFCLIVSCHLYAFHIEVSGYGTHANSADSNKKNMFKLCRIYH